VAEISNAFRPITAEQFRLLQNGLRGLLLFVRWIAVFAEDAANEHSDLCLGGFAERPVNRHAFADMGNQFPGDIFQRRFAENFNGAVVGFQRVIKSDFIIREANLSPRFSFASSINSAMTCQASMVRLW